MVKKKVHKASHFFFRTIFRYPTSQINHSQFSIDQPFLRLTIPNYWSAISQTHNSQLSINHFSDTQFPIIYRPLLRHTIPNNWSTTSQTHHFQSLIIHFSDSPFQIIDQPLLRLTIPNYWSTKFQTGIVMLPLSLLNLETVYSPVRENELRRN